jgi:hypothetical protein
MKQPKTSSRLEQGPSEKRKFIADDYDEDDEEQPPSVKVETRNGEGTHERHQPGEAEALHIQKTPPADKSQQRGRLLLKLREVELEKKELSLHAQLLELDASL